LAIFRITGSFKLETVNETFGIEIEFKLAEKGATIIIDEGLIVGK
jgi:hypothetical protein